LLDNMAADITTNKTNEYLFIEIISF
jgi:hypothetical protein